MATLSNLFVDGDQLRAIGTDADEWWVGADEFFRVRGTQFGEMPDFDLAVRELDAFEDGAVGWAVVLTELGTPTVTTPVRISTVLRLESGVWRIVQWHASVPTPNLQTFGVELTTTLDQLLASVGEDAAALASLGRSVGTMTLVFTDIVDSTALAERMGDTAWVELVSGHESAIRKIAESHHGVVVKMLGDGSMLTFESARAAIRACVEIQRSVVTEPFDVRIGVHAGDVVRTDDDVLGLTVNKAARVAAAGGAGDIMASATVCDLVGVMEGVEFGPSVTVALKGLAGTHQLIPIQWPIE